MFIVDTHMHTSPGEPPAVSWTPPPHIAERIRTNLAPFAGVQGEVTTTAEDHLRAMDEAGVAAAVLVQWHRDGPPVYELEWREREPGRFDVVYPVDPAAPRAAEDLRYWLGERGVSGIRLFSNFLTQRNSDLLSLDSPECRAMIAVAREAGASVAVQAPPEELPRIAHVFAENPDVTFILDHLSGASSAEALIALALHDNLRLKFSSGVLITHGEGPDPRSAQRAMLRGLVDGFGVERLMWGSNYPQTRVPLRLLVEHGLAVLDFLPAADVERVMGGNARGLWPFAAP